MSISSLKTGTISPGSLLVGNAAYSPSNHVTTGLILNLDAKNTASYPGSGTTWYDLSASGYNATLMNSPTYNAAGYFTFNGTTHNGSLPKPNPNPAGAVSCEIWFNQTSAADMILLHKGYHYTTRFLSADSWSWSDSNYNYSGFGYRTVTGINTLNTWKQIVVTKDTANDVRIYKNGSLVDTRTAWAPTSGTGVGPQYGAATAFLTGYSNDDTIPSGYMLTGHLAIVRMYSIALSGAQVLQNFNDAKARFGL